MFLPLALERLQTDDFLATFAYIATPNALFRALQRSEEIQRVQMALASGEISEDTIRAFVKHLTSELKRGEPFKYDLAIAAIAVTLARRATAFADEYLKDLAGLGLVEMNMSIRVARECLNARATLPKTAQGVIRLNEPDTMWSMNYEDLVSRYPQQAVGESKEEFVCQGVLCHN